jgi:hypothetical protein
MFILVMDVLNSIISKASERGLLQPILRRDSGQRVSIYADDVVMFLQPHREELSMVKEILRIFREASGLVTNIRHITLQHYEFSLSISWVTIVGQELQIVQDILPCSIVKFPCRYLRLSL